MHVARVEEIKKAYEVVLLEVRVDITGKPGLMWEDIIKMNLGEIGSGVWTGYDRVADLCECDGERSA